MVKFLWVFICGALALLVLEASFVVAFLQLGIVSTVFAPILGLSSGGLAWVAWWKANQPET